MIANFRVWFNFLFAVFSASLGICFLIDQTQGNGTTKHSIEEKLRLSRSISRCLLSKRIATKIAAVVYDNESAKLEFNFKSVSEVLNDSFEQMLHNQRKRKSSTESVSGWFFRVNAHFVPHDVSLF